MTRYTFCRYSRGCRSLVVNLTQQKQPASTQQGVSQDEEEDYDIPDEIEGIIG